MTYLGAGEPVCQAGAKLFFHLRLGSGCRHIPEGNLVGDLAADFRGACPQDTGGFQPDEFCQLDKIFIGGAAAWFDHRTVRQGTPTSVADPLESTGVPISMPVRKHSRSRFPLEPDRKNPVSFRKRQGTRTLLIGKIVASILIYNKFAVVNVPIRETDRCDERPGLIARVPEGAACGVAPTKTKCVRLLGRYLRNLIVCDHAVWPLDLNPTVRDEVALRDRKAPGNLGC